MRQQLLPIVLNADNGLLPACSIIASSIGSVSDYHHLNLDYWFFDRECVILCALCKWVLLAAGSECTAHNNSSATGVDQLTTPRGSAWHYRCCQSKLPLRQCVTRIGTASDADICLSHWYGEPGGVSC